MITDINELDLNKKYTYADYLTWQFDEMVELIRGKIFKMSPAPSLHHQRISRNLFLQVGNHLAEKRCEVFHAPFDVRLPLSPEKQTADKVDTIVQPDICVVCDPAKLDDRGCSGAPDWIIEILSKGTAQKDLNDKFELYQFAGVREYWVVHPHEGTVLAYVLDDQGRYQMIRRQPFYAPEKVPVASLPGFGVDLGVVFGE
ncbi:MAG: Uma2 family endonuclease [Bacteroidetes bacterium]|nr:Uma2 family endonuclease [Bacteroidota bacterium]